MAYDYDPNDMNLYPISNVDKFAFGGTMFVRLDEYKKAVTIAHIFATQLTRNAQNAS
jgi:hypothetical protein